MSHGERTGNMASGSLLVGGVRRGGCTLVLFFSRLALYVSSERRRPRARGARESGRPVAPGRAAEPRCALTWSVLGRDAEVVEKATDVALDGVADGADVVDGPARGIVQRSVEISLAGEDRAGVAAAHADDDIGGADDLVCPGLGELAGDVDAGPPPSPTAGATPHMDACPGCWPLAPSRLPWRHSREPRWPDRSAAIRGLFAVLALASAAAALLALVS